MENAAAIAGNWVSTSARKQIGSDTLLVVLFLAMDTGQNVIGIGFGEILSFLTIGGFVVLSYFMPSPYEKRDLGGWILTRLFVAAVGVISGIGLKVISEVFLMENLKFLPMTFLIFTGILCAITQMRAIIRVRLAG